MKKIISALMIAVCIGMAMPAQAQLIKFGVKGGVNLAKADFNKSDLKTDNFTGFFIGPMAEVTIPLVGLGVDGALLFAQRGVKTLPKKADKNRHGALHSLASRCVWHEKSRIHANAAFLLRVCEFVTLLLLPAPACSCRCRQE